MTGVRSQDPVGTIQNLGAEIGRAFAKRYPAFASIDAPQCIESLRPLVDYFDQLRRVFPAGRFTVVIDEFDEIPVELYKRGSVGDTFFGSLRNLTSGDGVHLILVGGERMKAIIDAQGTRLNRFETLPVDYFSRERDWDDFCELVRMPVAEKLEIADDAISHLFEESAGHPFFTKLICARMFERAIERRDAHVTEYELHDSCKEAIRRAQQNYFAHFWEDGIAETDDRLREVISVRRRKVLLALSEAGSSGEVGAPRQLIVETARDIYDLVEAGTEEEINRLLEREVLVQTADKIRCKVPLFGKWLVEHGRAGVGTSYTVGYEIEEALAEQRQLAEVEQPELRAKSLRR